MNSAALNLKNSNQQQIATAAFQQMRESFSQLKQSNLTQRLTALSEVRDTLLLQREMVVDSLMRECGKTRTDANIEIIGALDWLKWLEDHSAQFLADEKVPTPMTLMGKKSKIIHEPLGPVLIIAPWNYPFHIGITQIFTAFACGNTVVYKPSEITPMQGIYEEILSASPLICSSVAVVYGSGELGAALINQQPEKIFFTGSTRTGKAISRQAADYLIPVDLELGGKDPMIVFDSASIKRVAAAAVWGAFTHNGQSCSAVERLYVQESIYPEVLAELKAETAKLVQKTSDKKGDVDLGRLTVDFQYNIVKQHIADAKAKGAEILIGGEVIDEEQLLHSPTIITEASSDMLVVKEETFGPVLPVIKFRTEEEAIALANDSEFGLQASIFTADMQQGERVMQQLEVGGVSINNVNMVEGNPWLSFGGRKQTGSGRARGVEGLMAFTRSKHVLTDPNSDKLEANWYPYTQTKYQLLHKFTDALFRRSPLRLLKVALVGLKLESVSQKPRQ